MPTRVTAKQTKVHNRSLLWLGLFGQSYQVAGHSFLATLFEIEPRRHAL
jgi:hypothetical protein